MLYQLTQNTTTGRAVQLNTITDDPHAVMFDTHIRAPRPSDRAPPMAPVSSERSLYLRLADGPSLQSSSPLWNASNDSERVLRDGGVVLVDEAACSDADLPRQRLGLVV